MGEWDGSMGGRLKRGGINVYLWLVAGLPWRLSGKESTCNSGDTVSIPGSGRLQCSCLENSMN